MEELVKKLEQLNELIKAVKATGPVAQKAAMPALPKLPEIKPPPPPSMTGGSVTPTKISSGEGPNSKKDPKKMAEQIKNGSMSTKTQKVMLKADSKTGQWYLEKATATDWEENPEDLTWPANAYGKDTGELTPLTDSQKKIISAIVPESHQESTVERLTTGKGKTDPALIGHTTTDKDGDKWAHSEKIPSDKIKQWHEMPTDFNRAWDNDEVDRDYRRDHATGKLYHTIQSGPHSGTYLPVEPAKSQQQLKEIATQPDSGLPSLNEVKYGPASKLTMKSDSKTGQWYLEPTTPSSI